MTNQTSTRRRFSLPGTILLLIGVYLVTQAGDTGDWVSAVSVAGAGAVTLAKHSFPHHTGRVGTALLALCLLGMMIGVYLQARGV